MIFPEQSHFVSLLQCEESTGHSSVDTRKRRQNITCVGINKSSHHIHISYFQHCEFRHNLVYFVEERKEHHNLFVKTSVFTWTSLDQIKSWAVWPKLTKNCFVCYNEGISFGFFQRGWKRSFVRAAAHLRKHNLLWPSVSTSSVGLLWGAMSPRSLATLGFLRQIVCNVAAIFGDIRIF